MKPLRRGRARRVRQRWRWVPLSLRLRFAQVRNRWAHRRALKRVVFAGIAAVVVTVLATSNSRDGRDEVSVLAVPDGHRVVSVPIDETIPPLVVGDEIDFYLAPTLSAGLAGDAGGVDVLTEPGVVVSIVDEALAVAVPEDVIATLVASLADDAVLVVRR